MTTPELAAAIPSNAAAPVRPRVWTVFVAYVLAFAAAAVLSLFAVGIAYAVQAMLKGASPTPPQSMRELMGNPTNLIASVAATSSTLCLSAILLGLVSPTPFTVRLRLTGSGPRPWVWAVATVGAIAIGQAFESVASLAGIPESEPLAAVAKAAGETTVPAFALLLLFGALLAGIAEELFFRGYMQTRLVARFGRWPGIALTSVAFGIIHMDPVHSAGALLIGLYLGWLAERAGHIRLPMTVHVLNNAASFALARAFGDSWESAGPHAILLAASALTGVAVIALLIRMPQPLDAKLSVSPSA
jgi:membrane protease YdiL (CAAX protease family)